MDICEVSVFEQLQYLQALALQAQLADDIWRQLRPQQLLLMQHPPTYTFGRRGNSTNLLWSEAELARRGIQVHWVDRGGDVTYHGPGQLVGYPLLQLGPIASGQDESRLLPYADYVGYLRKLERVLVQALEKLGFASHTLPGITGVFVHLPQKNSAGKSIEAKIASIGIKVDAHGVSRHGFALNVNPIMEHWQGIIACGLADTPITSLAELDGSLPGMKTVQESVAHSFGNVFNFEIKWV